MKINKIQSAQNVKFDAKLRPYPNNISNSKVFELFEEKTKDFPNLILKQDDISYFKNDYFILLHQDKPNIVSHGYFSYTNNRPKTIESIVDRLVTIFDTLKKEPIPKMHKD